MRYRIFFFALIVLHISFGLQGQANIKTNEIKQSIINNYLHFLSRKDSAPKLLDPLILTTLDIPTGYKPYVKLEVLDSAQQFFLSDSIELYSFSGLGYAYKVEGDTINVLDYSPYLIEKSGFIVRSGIGTHRGIIGIGKNDGRILYFSGPLLLHDVRYLTIERELIKETILAYLKVKYYSEEITDIDIKVKKEGLSYCADFFLNGSREICLFFHKDVLTRYIIMDKLLDCSCTK